MEKELPKNWVETDLEHLFNLVYGKGLSVGELLDEGFDVYGANGIIGKYDKFTYEKSKVIISCRGAASGVIHKTKPQSFITSNSIVLDEVSDELLNLDFVKYAMTIADKSDVITGTAQPQITIQLLKYLQFPLPPLTEQNRIVAKLDALFAQLETIKNSMEKVPLLLKDFRQQVLTQAVTGKLTEEWRKGKELDSINVDLSKINLKELSKVTLKPLDFKFELPQNWEWYNLNYLCSKITDGEHITPELTNNGIPLLSAKDVRTNYLDFSDVKYVSEIIAKKSRARCNPEKGDILVVSRGATVGRCTIVEINDVFCLMGSVLLFKPLNKYIDSKYLEYYFKSDWGLQDIIGRSGATAQQAVYIRDMKEFGIPLPPIKEQQEIVTRVESLFAKADAIEKQYETLKAKIDSLPQAILHKAFKGELTEQLDSDGDARELLREIEGVKAMSGKVSKKGKSKTTKSVAKKV